MTRSSATHSIPAQSRPDSRNTPEASEPRPTAVKTVGQGAATSVLLAASPLVEGIGGRYLDDCNESPIVGERPEDFRGVAPYALDPDNATRSWDIGTAFADLIV
jgi:hypothetical protein